MTGQYGTTSAIRNSGAGHVAGHDRIDVPRLADDEIHVWTVGIDGQVNGDAASVGILAPAERARASRFRSGMDAACFIQRRTALRKILGAYLGVAPQDVVFALNEFGKPSVAAPQTGLDLSFNTSHSDGLALITVSRSIQIGVDLERLRKVEGPAIAARFFAANEAASLAGLGADDQVEGFFNAWTRKEAIVKALGRGLFIPLDSFEVSLRPREPVAILRWNIPGAAAEEWRICDLKPTAGYVGALAWNSRAMTYRCLRWPD